MIEHIYRKHDGSLLLKGIKSVGIESTAPMQDIYCYKTYGAIEGQPEEICDDVFFGAMISRND